MPISFTYYGVACGVLSINDEFYIGIDPDLSPQHTTVQFKGFSSTRMSPTYDDQKLLNKVNLWLLTHEHQDHLDDIGKGFLASRAVICHSKKIPLF